MIEVAPLISFVVPVHRTEPKYLSQLLASAAAQTDPDWELILVDDGSDDPTLTAALSGAAEADGRVRVRTLAANEGIVAASNSGMAMARGQFVALVDHDDVIDPEAVARCRSVIDADPQVDVLYSDETIIGPAGELLGEFRKPVFSPERLRGQMYTGHLGVYRRTLLAAIGGFRGGFDGSQDYDLVLRASEQARIVRSIPHALYRWRTLPTSVSHAAGNEHVFAAARRALTDHLDRTGIAATVVQTDPTGRYRIIRRLSAGASVSVLVPSSGARAFVDGADRVALPYMLRSLMASLDACRDVDTQVAVLAGAALPDDVAARALDALGTGGGIRRVAGDPWSPSVLNEAVIASPSDYILLVGEWVTLHPQDWPAALVGLAQDPTVGVVAPRLLCWDGRVAAAGIALIGGSARPIGEGAGAGDSGPYGALQVDREVTAVPADCLLLSRALFLEVGGLSMSMTAASAVVDLCFKVRELGRRIVLTVLCDAKVGAGAVAPTTSELKPLLARWGSRLAADDYWRDAG